MNGDRPSTASTGGKRGLRSGVGRTATKIPERLDAIALVHASTIVVDPCTHQL